MYPHDMNGPMEMAGRVEVTKLLFALTGTHNDMTVRPYKTYMDGRTVNQFAELTDHGRSIAPSIIAGVANQFMRPTSEHQGFINIDNGWHEQRLRFLLEVTFYDGHGTPTSVKIVQGYTSHPGFSTTGAMDHSMVLYLNNITSLRQQQVMIGNQDVVRAAVESSNHILRGDYKPEFTQGRVGGTVTHLMRPQDLFYTMDSEMLDLGGDKFDARRTFASGSVQKSRRSNNNASYYLSDSLKAYRHATANSDDHIDASDMYNTARGMVKEEVVSGDRLLLLLQNSSPTFNEKGCVTYGEMCSIFPEFDQRAYMLMPRELEQQNQGTPWSMHHAGDTENWTGSNTETIWSSILSQSVPSILIDLMMTRVAFTATNQTRDGRPDIRIMDAGGFSKHLDLTPYIGSFIERIQNEVISSLSQSNGIDFNLTMLVDILKDTRITLQIQNGQPIEFASPSYCDALFTPVLTNDSDNISNLTHDFQALSNDMGADSPYRGIVPQNQTGAMNGYSI